MKMKNHVFFSGSRLREDDVFFREALEENVAPLDPCIKLCFISSLLHDVHPDQIAIKSQPLTLSTPVSSSSSRGCGLKSHWFGLRQEVFSFGLGIAKNSIRIPGLFWL